MKKYFAIFLSLVIALSMIMAVAVSAAENLIANGDLADDFGTDDWNDGWGMDDCYAEYDPDTSYADDGTGSIHIHTEATSNPVQHKQQKGVVLEAGKTYIISGYIKTSVPGQTCLSFGGDASPIKVYPTKTDEWEYVEGTYTNDTEEDINTTFQVRVWGAAGDAWFDNLSLVEVTDTPTGDASVIAAAVVAVALAAAVVLRKKETV